MSNDFLLQIVRVLADECLRRSGNGPYYDYDQSLYLDAADALEDLYDELSE